MIQLAIHDPTHKPTNPSANPVARHVAIMVTKKVIIPLRINPNRMGAARCGNIDDLSGEMERVGGIDPANPI
jgi:hypothetical protein